MYVFGKNHFNSTFLRGRKDLTLILCFLEGFHAVFPMEKLHPFTPDELQLMLSGEQVPQWTREDIMNYTEPKFGYTREAPGFQRFVNVLVNMNGDERKVTTWHSALSYSLKEGQGLLGGDWGLGGRGEVTRGEVVGVEGRWEGGIYSSGDDLD